MPGVIVGVDSSRRETLSQKVNLGVNLAGRTRSAGGSETDSMNNDSILLSDLHMTRKSQGLVVIGVSRLKG